MRRRTRSNRSAMDGAAAAGEEAVMTPDGDKLWTTAQALNASVAAVSPGAARLPPLLFFTDPARTPEPWLTAERLPAGAGVVFRHFGAAARREAAERLLRACRGAGVRLLIGADATLAEAIGADGVHLPEREAGQALLLAAARPDWLITAAAHAGAQAQPGAHARILSPVLPAGGASASQTALGPEEFRTEALRLGAPVYALGGLAAHNIDALEGSGACGVAGVAAIQAAFGPGA